MSRLRTENSDRFMAKYGTHELHNEFDPLNDHPNKFLLKYSKQMSREHALRALRHPNEVFAGFAANSSGYLKKSDLEDYLKTGQSEHVKDVIQKRFKIEATPHENLNWLDKILKDQYKYHPEDNQ
jgi:hypothetical protein